MKTALVLCIIAALVVASMGESAIEKLKAKVNAGAGAAPCDKNAPAAPAAPKQFLDQRLPHVVDDYHPPVGGFNPSHIPDKEVDVAARKILREIQKFEAEKKANGDGPQAPDTNAVISTEEHKALKQLLLDADILVRAATKSLGENGPIEAEARKVAVSAVKKAAGLEKKANKKAGKKGKKGKKGGKKGAKKAAAPAAAAVPKVGASKAAAPAVASGKAATRL